MEEPRPERSEEFFKCCNKWAILQQGPARIIPALGVLGVSADDAEDIIKAGKSIWERCVGHTVQWRKKCVTDQEQLEKAKDEIRAEFPIVFGMSTRGVQEKKFLLHGAPDAIIRFANEAMRKKELSEQKLKELVSAATSTGTPSADSELGRSTTIDTQEEDTETEELAVVGERRILKRKRQRVVLSPAASDRATLQPEPKRRPEARQSRQHTDRGRLKELLNMSSEEPSAKTQGHAIKEEQKELTEIAPFKLHARLKMSGLSVNAERIKYIEICSANDKSELCRLELKHLSDQHESSVSVPNLEKLERNVKEFPLIISWPDRLIFVHVPLGGTRNILIFNQATLETAFQDWERDEPQANVFRVYVSESEGRPPKITLP